MFSISPSTQLLKWCPEKNIENDVKEGAWKRKSKREKKLNEKKAFEF